MVRWDKDLWLFTVSEFDQLPNGIELECVDGTKAVKGQDYIDLDTRAGHIAYGVRNPENHDEAELFTVLMLKYKHN